MPEIHSPCIRNCCLDDADICLGCFRSIEEILQWRGASDRQKKQILRLARARQHEHRLAMRSARKKDAKI